MLDVLRKHASSWMIKAILGAIIISFVFFFGYSSYRKGMRGGRAGAEGAMAAKVNGTPVSLSEFEFYFDRNFDRMRASFGDKEMPDFARKLARSTTLNQLVAREIALQQADELGITIPDAELADVIMKSQSAQEGGGFDPIAYRYRFLPYFKNRFGLDYEQLVRQDLRLEAVEGLFRNVEGPSPPAGEGEEEKKTVWTFETIAIDPNALIESKMIESTDEAAALAEKLVAANPKEWKKILRDLKIEPKNTGPVGISERRSLLGGEGPIEDHYRIFALTKEHPVIGRPIQRGGKFYVVRLVEKVEKADKGASAPPAGDFFQEWMGKLLAKAKVENFLEKEK